MTNVELSGSSTATRAEHQLAQRWADFTKALSIYPETNTRVQRCLEGLFSAHARAVETQSRAGLQPGTGVAILFRGNVLAYDDVEEEISEATTLNWLRLRLDRAALAGVEFLPDLSAESLIEFTKDLLAVYLRKEIEPCFEKLWPRAFPGLRLVDRRFEGAFGGPSTQAPYRGGHADRGPTAPQERDAVRVLLSDPGIVERLQALNRRVEALELPEEERRKATDLLDRIVQNLPADSMKNRRHMVSAVRSALEALASRVEGTPSSAPHGATDTDRTMSALLHSVSRTHFARQGPDQMRWALEEALPEAEDSARKLGHVGDDAVTEDLTALMAEIDALPSVLDPDLSPAQAEVPAEELAVLLHFLVHAEDAEQFPGLYPLLDAALENPGAEELDVLREYLLAEARTNPDAAETPPIMRFLRSRHKTHLLRASKVFCEEWVVQMFPQYFVSYLEAMELRTQRDIDELNSVCTTIGPTRMLSNSRVLDADSSLLDSDAAARLLLQPHAARVALARLLLQWFGKNIIAEVTAFLRRIDLPEPEAFLLYQLPDPEYLSQEYVRGLIDLHLGRADDKKLHVAIAETLCRHVRATRETDPRGPERLESIRNLARFASASSWFMLEELSRKRWWRINGREPAVVRRLARSMRKYIRRD